MREDLVEEFRILEVQYNKFKLQKIKKLEEFDKEIDILEREEHSKKYEQFSNLLYQSSGKNELKSDEFRRIEIGKKVELERFLNKFSFVELQSICVMNNIFVREHHNIKSKLIVRIANFSLEIDAINERIERSKYFKFIVECDNADYPFDGRWYFSNSSVFEKIEYKLNHNEGRHTIFNFYSCAENETCTICGEKCGPMVYYNIFCKKNKKIFSDAELKLIDETSNNLINENDKIPDNLTNNETLIILKKTNTKENKKKQIPPKLKEKVWNKYVGDKISCPCPICEGVTISSFSFECAHVTAETNGGLLEVENLRAICGSCNKSMNSRHMKSYVEEFYPNSSILSTFIQEL